MHVRFLELLVLVVAHDDEHFRLGIMQYAPELRDSGQGGIRSRLHLVVGHRILDPRGGLGEQVCVAHAPVRLIFLEQRGPVLGGRATESMGTRKPQHDLCHREPPRRDRVPPGQTVAGRGTQAILNGRDIPDAGAPRGRHHTTDSGWGAAIELTGVTARA